MMLVLSRRDGESIVITTEKGAQANLKRLSAYRARFAIAGDGCKIYSKFKTENNFAVVDMRAGEEITVALPCGEQVDVTCLYVGRQAKLGFTSQLESTVILRHEVAVKSQLAG